MNKQDLINAVADATGLTQRDAGKTLNVFLESITTSLVNGEDVVLVGFGSFSIKERAARTGRNPSTGEPINISAQRVPSFKAGKSLKDSVNG